MIENYKQTYEKSSCDPVTDIYNVADGNVWGCPFDLPPQVAILEIFMANL